MTLTYNRWLHLMCKWSTVGLTYKEYETFDKLGTELNKHCPCDEDCACEGLGLLFTPQEQDILDIIDLCKK